MLEIKQHCFHQK